MYESHRSAPLSRQAFARRVARHVGVALLVMGISLAGGVAGYRVFGGLGWDEAFLHAAVPLSGLGLAEVPGSPGGRLFAGLYALYAGLVLLGITAIVVAPIAHRLLHLFHWEEEDER